jgi:hypothetical protein
MNEDNVQKFWDLIQTAADDPQLLSIDVPKPKMGQRPPPLEISDTATRRLDDYRLALAQYKVSPSSDSKRFRRSQNVRFLAIIGVSLVYLLAILLIVYMLRGTTDLSVVLGTHAGAVAAFLVVLKMLISSDEKATLLELQREREEGFILAISSLAPSLDSKTILLVLREAAKVRSRR